MDEGISRAFQAGVPAVEQRRAVGPNLDRALVHRVTLVRTGRTEREHFALHGCNHHIAVGRGNNLPIANVSQSPNPRAADERGTKVVYMEEEPAHSNNGYNKEDRHRSPCDIGSRVSHQNRTRGEKKVLEGLGRGAIQNFFHALLFFSADIIVGIDVIVRRPCPNDGRRSDQDG